MIEIKESSIDREANSDFLLVYGFLGALEGFKEKDEYQFKNISVNFNEKYA